MFYPAAAGSANVLALQLYDGKPMSTPNDAEPGSTGPEALGRPGAGVCVIGSLSYAMLSLNLKRTWSAAMFFRFLEDARWNEARGIFY